MREYARAAYDAWHRAQAPDSGDAPWHRLLKPRLSGLRDARVLEIACGAGGFAVWLGGLPPDVRPREVVASDFSPVAVEMAEALARSRGATNVTCRVGDVMDLAWGAGTFDAVISCETIEHVAEPETGVRELARALRPGGRLYLTCPSYLNLTGLYRCYLPLTGRSYTEGGQPISHCLFLPRVKRWVRRAGLRLEQAVGSGHYVPWPGRSPIRVSAADRLGRIGTLFALHTLIVARKPASPREGAR